MSSREYSVKVWDVKEDVVLRNRQSCIKGLSVGDEGLYENFGFTAVPEINRVVRHDEFPSNAL